MSVAGLTSAETAQLRGLDGEGRCVATDHGAFVLFNVYVPALSGEEGWEVPLPSVGGAGPVSKQ